MAAGVAGRRGVPEPAAAVPAQSTAAGRPRPAADPALLAAVRRRLAGVQGQPTPEQLTDAVRACAAVLGSRALAELVAAVSAELLGAGPLQPLVEDPMVTDVLVNGPRQVWVDRGDGLERVDLALGTDEDVRALAVRLAAAGGRRLDEASPIVDARLPDGTRLHAVLAPVVGHGAVISLRTLRRLAFTLAELVAGGTVPPALAGVLRAMVAGKVNLLISGGTGAGKTTLLATLLSLVPHDERIVCIEETGELVPDHPHVVSLAVRRANAEGIGEIDLVTLVRTALRMRPDRLVLGECRGAEVREVLSALNTGHQGGCATIHANTAADVPTRIEALAALAGMDRAAAAAQGIAAIDVVVHMERMGGARRVTEVAVVGRDHDGMGVRRALTALDDRVLTGPGWPELAARLGMDGAAAAARARLEPSSGALERSGPMAGPMARSGQGSGGHDGSTVSGGSC